MARWMLYMDNPYLEVISYVERIHRQFLEVVKLELEGFGIHDINNVQAMMLFNIGDAEMTVGELTLRGCYLGSNVSYNVRKMVENEYLAHERSVHDRRSIHVRLTEKGIKLRDSLTTMHRRHAEMLSQAAVGADDLQAVGVTLRRPQRFWIRAADLVQRMIWPMTNPSRAISRCSSAETFGGNGTPSGVCSVARRSAALRSVGLKLRMPSRMRVA